MHVNLEMKYCLNQTQRTLKWATSRENLTLLHQWRIACALA